MVRLFVSDALSKQAPFPLNEKAAHYLVHVMRLKSGDELLCFNGKDGEWRTRLEIKGKKQFILIPLSQTRPQTKPNFLALCPALIKKDNFDFVLQKATELGVTDIYPLLTDYVTHAHLNMDHANSIVREAAEQSERLTLPTIHAPVRLAQVMDSLPPNCVCCYLSERTNQANMLPSNADIAFLIGPEGGWSEKEIAFLKSQKGFIGLHFDCGILRAETANIAILSCWQIGRQLNWKK